MVAFIPRFPFYTVADDFWVISLDTDPEARTEFPTCQPHPRVPDVRPTPLSVGHEPGQFHESPQWQDRGPRLRCDLFPARLLLRVGAVQSRPVHAATPPADLPPRVDAAGCPVVGVPVPSPVRQKQYR